MTTTAGTASTNLLRRVYAYGGIAHTEAWAIEVLSLCQQVVNAFTQNTADSASLTVVAATPSYNLYAVLPEAVDVLKVTEDVAGTYYTLSRTWSPEELAAYDADWLAHATGTRYLAWCQVGRNLLFIYPTKAANGTVSVFYSKLTTAMAIAADLFEVSDEDVPFVTDLAEIVLLAQDKQLTVCMDKILQLAEHLGLEVSEK